MSGPRYRAFISYSHVDSQWAAWLHRELENYRVPRRLVGTPGETGPVPARLIPVFRDREDLASAGELGPRIEAALEDSAAMVVVCSPAAATSPWVNREVLAFKEKHHGQRPVLCLIVGGEPHGVAGEDCFPPALIEPIAADVRPGKDGKALARLKLIAGLLGIELDHLRQRETQRKHRRLIAITSAALLVMLVTSLLAVQAVVARHAAERRQKQAEQLVSFMLGDLNDKLAQVQRLDIMEAVDDQAMAYFQSLPTSDVTDEALSQRALALQKIGSVRLDQGKLPAAMQSYRASAKLTGQLAKAAPRDLARQLAHAEALAFIGTTHWYLGELDNAQASFASARDLLQAQQRNDGADNPELLFQLSTLDNNIGHVLEGRDRMDEAAGHYQRMLIDSHKLVRADPDKAEWLVQLGAAHNNLGKMALMRGELSAALAQYAADEAIQAQLAAKDPKDNNQQTNLLTVRAILGRTQALAGDVQGGKVGLGQAVLKAGELAADDPDNTGIRELHGLYSLQLARLHRLSDEPDQAQRLVTQSLAVLGALTRHDPTNATWQRELAEAQLEAAAQALLAGSSEKAASQVGTALSTLDGLVASQPGDRGTVLAAAGGRLLLAKIAPAPEREARLAQTLALLDSVSSGREDPRLVALRVEALLALQRRDQADPAIEQLGRGGYRDLAYLSVLRDAGIDPDAANEARTNETAAR